MAFPLSLSAALLLSILASLFQTPSLAKSSIPSRRQAPPALSSRDVAQDACGTLFNWLQANYTVFTALQVYDCLIIVSLNHTVATQFISYYKDTLEFQSTLAYLKDPPASYQQPAVDLLAGLDRIQGQVDAGILTTQYDFELAVQTLVYSAHDSHLQLYAGLTDVFSFGSPFYVSSVSEDGVAIPKVYFTEDLISAQQSGGQWNASAIHTVNGQPATDFFTQFAAENSQGYLEPHADWNNLMYSPASDIQGLVNAFEGSSPFYPGDVFSLVLENGTGVPDLTWLAVINDLSNVVSIANYSDFYSYFVVDDYDDYTAASARRKKRDSVTSPPTVSTSSTAPTQTSWSDTFFPLSLAYPQNPAVVEPNLGDGGVITGYFLEESSTGVLSIPNFSSDDVMAFSTTVGNFLQKSKASGVKKIVIDLQQNWGGLTLLATDTFKQFFPTIDPFGGSRERAQKYAYALGNTYTNYYNASLLNPNQSLSVDYSNNVWVAPLFLDAATGQNFSSWAQYFGPHQDGLDYFTTIQRDNLSSIPFDEASLGAVVDGYANRTNLTAVSPYAAEDIIILTDALCASTCTLFVEMMHHEAGVRTVVAGGRPQVGPMQALAGTRGARYYEAADIDSDIFLAEAINVSVTADLPDRDIEFRIDVASFNLRDQVRRGENFPLQFAYEAADCRIFFTPQTFNHYAALWQYAADAIWTNPKLCVQGSTNQPSAGNTTDTVGPTAAEKASWAGKRSYAEFPANGEKRSPSVSRIHGVHGLDYDSAARTPGTSCAPNDPRFCGANICVPSPRCDPRTGAFSTVPQCQFPCGRLCPMKILGQPTHCQAGGFCLTANTPTNAQKCQLTRTTTKQKVPVGLPNQPQSKPPTKKSVGQPQSVGDLIMEGIRS